MGLFTLPSSDDYCENVKSAIWNLETFLEYQTGDKPDMDHLLSCAEICIARVKEQIKEIVMENTNG